MFASREREPMRAWKALGRCRDTGAMGMNPFRPHRRTPADYVMVAAALLVIAALVFWAFHG